MSALGAEDLHWFNEGTHERLYEKLGAHALAAGGARFALWAPDAVRVSVVGDFNDWDPARHPLEPRERSGIWEGVAPEARLGQAYKYRIRPRYGGPDLEKADPFALRSEIPPKTASILWNLDYAWGDGAWMSARARRNALDAPISIYEVHLGSWRRNPEEGGRTLSYREIARPLADYTLRMGFTHVEFLPLMEHPYSKSWGYQTTGYFAATSRYGTPQDLMYLVDTLHQAGLGVLFDWVPSHFPSDAHGLASFDGTHLYEHGDPRRGFHPDWKSLIFNYGRHEVRSFLLSSALFWLDRYHADGLRVDAVASMLYLDYSRREGEWLPNAEGGRENTEAISFLRRLNEAVYGRHPGVQTFAEESTAWPSVSRPTYAGGLGFGLKWDMGWMHDALDYFSKDPVHRKHHHDRLTFRMLYAFSENFVLPFSHDEVVHGKGSLLARMPGDAWQKFANLRLLLGLLYAQPGKKLLFMGSEFGQEREWDCEQSLDWHLCARKEHAGVQAWIADLNAAYRRERALHELDCESAGFEWVDCSDRDQSVVSFLRLSRSREAILAVLNATPVPRRGYRVGVPSGGLWRELLNSDRPEYGGGALGNGEGARAEPVRWHGRPRSLSLTLPPLGILFLRRA